LEQRQTLQLIRIRAGSRAFPEPRLENDMLRLMRRSAVWFLIAVLWLVIALITALHQGWQRAWLQAVVALAFFGAGAYLRRKEGVR
jgi:hypothetical protein